MAVYKGEKQLSELAHLQQPVTAMLDDLAWWTRALKAARDAG